MGKLSMTAVKAATRPGRFCDGDGLFLVVQSQKSALNHDAQFVTSAQSSKGLLIDRR